MLRYRPEDRISMTQVVRHSCVLGTADRFVDLYQALLLALGLRTAHREGGKKPCKVALNKGVYNIMTTKSEFGY